MNEHDYAVIMAGGSGTRLWPLSRRNRPKQFQCVLGGESMLQRMYSLLCECFAASHVMVQTEPRYVELTREHLPGLPEENLLCEPEPRDTAPAFGFAGLTIISRNPEAHLGVFCSDHMIGDAEAFQRAVRAAYSASHGNPEALVMIGVEPDHAHTGLGYIQQGPQVGCWEAQPVFSAQRFVEIPPLAAASELIATGGWLWNTGYKICRAAHLLELIGSVDEGMAAALETLRPLINDPCARAAVEWIYHTLPKVSFEQLIAQQLNGILVVPTRMGWSDVGDWNTLMRILEAEMAHRPAASSTTLDCEGCSVFSVGGRLVAALGLTDILIVDCPDALLVVNKKDTQALKDLVELLERKDQDAYL